MLMHDSIKRYKTKGMSKIVSEGCSNKEKLKIC